MLHRCVYLVLMSLIAACGYHATGNSNNGSDGGAYCGDGVLDPGEECDNGDDNSDTEPDACRKDCRSPRCGDLAVDTGEDCVRGSVDGVSCLDMGFVSGTLWCDYYCQWDVSRCNYCGNGTIDDNEECDDGNQDATDRCHGCLTNEFQVNTYTDQYQSDPAAAMAEDGRFVVVWQSSSQDGDGAGVFGQRFSPSGEQLGAEFQVNTAVASGQQNPAIAMAADGRFVVVWQSWLPDVNKTDIYGQRFSAIGVALGEEFRVNTAVISSQRNPVIAIAGDGYFVVVWQSLDSDGSGEGIVAKRYNADGVSIGEEFNVNTCTVSQQREPAIAMAQDGRFVVVWQSTNQDGSDSGVFGQQYGSDGLPESLEFQVNTYTDESQRLADVAIAENGQFVVVWSGNGQDGETSGVFGQMYAGDGSARGGEFQINTYTYVGQSSPTVAMSADGRFVVFWHSPQDGSFDGVFGQRYASDGSLLGGEFQVNAYTQYEQAYPSVAMSSDGSSLVTWSSYYQDGSEMGVFAKLYDANGIPVYVSN